MVQRAAIEARDKRIELLESGLRQLHDENIRLKTELKQLKAQQDELRKMEREMGKQEARNALEREIGKLEAMLEMERAKRKDDDLPSD